MNLTEIQDFVTDTVKQVIKQERTCKTEGGTCYPAADFAVVPDGSKPSTWKLRLSQGSPGNITKSQLGRAAAAFSSGGFRGNQVKLGSGEATKAKARIRREYTKLGVKREDMPDSVKELLPSYIWKDESGQYHWMAAYTNNFRDNDNPPEIISTQAHKEFDDAVNKGDWPMPEVWLWHYPYPVGQTHTHVFDEKSGFCIAGGTFDKDKAWAAKGIMARGWQGVSHGMPKKHVRREAEDQTIITGRRTKEITFLPSWAAANNLAFHIISKENGMTEQTKEIPAHKREEFVETFGEERVQKMEDEVAAKVAKAKEQGTESKEAAPDPAPEQPQEQAEEQATPETMNQDVAAALQVVVSSLNTVTEAVKGIDDRLKEIEKSDKEKIEKQASAIPDASLEAFVKSQLFTEGNEVDDKGKGPKQTANKQDGSSGLFFNELGWTNPVTHR